MADQTMFKYTARNSATGKKVTGQIQAENQSAAGKILVSQGLSPLEIVTPEQTLFGGLFGKFGKKIKAKDKIIFSRQLSTLIGAGLPLLQSLRTVLEQTKGNGMREVIVQIIAAVEGGSSLSNALEKHPSVFDQVFRGLIAAGEASGTLDQSLERLAFQQEKDAEIMSKVRGAMVYPIIVVIVMVLVVGFMLIAVLPQVKVLYDGFPGARLPGLTLALLALSDFVQNFWWLVGGLVVGLAIGMKQWSRTVSGKNFFDKVKMKVPPFGPLFMKLYMARFSRTGATLFASGVPMIQMLEITARAVNNIYIEQSVKGAIEKIKGGKALSDSIENDPNFLYLVPNMLRIGEQSGQIEQMMSRTAEYYEKEVDNQIKTISTIIEPVMIVTLGAIAILIVGAVLIPIYGLAGKIN